MAPNIILLTFLLAAFTLAAPAPARPAAAIPPCYEIVITAGSLPSPTNNPLDSKAGTQAITSRISVVTPAPELRHRQFTKDLLPTETETDYYWDGETPYSWPAGEYPPWIQNGGTIVNTGRLVVTLGKRAEDEKRQLAPITYASSRWGNTVLPVQTEPGWWGDGKTFTFAGQTFTLGGTGMLTITLGRPPRDLGVRTAAFGDVVEERQELSWVQGSTRDGGFGTATERQVVTYTDGSGAVQTLTVG